MVFSLEQIEREDWALDDNQSNLSPEYRRLKAISGYYLNRWYDAVKNYTFPTEIYPIPDYNTADDPDGTNFKTALAQACPDTLPFTKCMVRFESKSPKDSELWGPVTTKAELIELFYTSLRCRRQPGKFLCIRQWQDGLGQEYRCFWNQGLVAVGVRETNVTVSLQTMADIVEFIGTMSRFIPYHRCVIDIVVVDTEVKPSFCGYRLIEFNSWETNSGAAPFDWIEDSGILYPEDFFDNHLVNFQKKAKNPQYGIIRTVFRTLTDHDGHGDQAERSNELTLLQCQTSDKQFFQLETRQPRFYDVEVSDFYELWNVDRDPPNYVKVTSQTILTPPKQQPGSAIVIKVFDTEYLYVASDIYLYRYELRPVPEPEPEPTEGLSAKKAYTLRVLNWVRGVFRFHPPVLNVDGTIEAGGKLYGYDLTPLRQPVKIKSKTKSRSVGSLGTQEVYDPNKRYGFAALDQTGREIFVRISSNGELYLLVD